MKPSMRWLFSITLGLFALGTIGCGSVVPISDVSESVLLPDLAGHWQTTGPDDEIGQMLVLKFNEHAYYVEFREEGTEVFDEDVLRLRAYFTEIDDRLLINAQNIDSIDEDDRLYFFYAYDLDENGEMVITELQDVEGQDLDGFETSEALRAFVRENLDNEAFYGEAITFVRINVNG